MTVIVVATIFPVPEWRGEIVDVMTQTIARVHREDDGCQLYALHEGEDRLVMIEKWESLEHLGAHGRSAGMRAFTEQLAGKVRLPMDLQVLQPVPAGTREQGQL